MDILGTDRLALRRLSGEDAAFILRLLNEPSFIRNIGDKGVRTMADANQYIREKMTESYERWGYGLYMVELHNSRTAVGICGLVKREAFKDPDIGFAFLPEHWSKGYAVESAAAVLGYARDILGFKRVLGITSQDNAGSIRVLEKIGLRLEGVVKLTADGQECKLFALDLAAPSLKSD